MSVHYGEGSKPAALKLGCKMCSIDIGGGLTWQGPATPAQQAKLAVLLSEIQTANAELESKLPALIDQVKIENAEKARQAKQPKPATKK